MLHDLSYYSPVMTREQADRFFNDRAGALSYFTKPAFATVGKLLVEKQSIPAAEYNYYVEKAIKILNEDPSPDVNALAKDFKSYQNQVNSQFKEEGALMKETTRRPPLVEKYQQLRRPPMKDRGSQNPFAVDQPQTTRRPPREEQTGFLQETYDRDVDPYDLELTKTNHSDL